MKNSKLSTLAVLAVAFVFVFVGSFDASAQENQDMDLIYNPKLIEIDTADLSSLSKAQILESFSRQFLQTSTTSPSEQVTIPDGPTELASLEKTSKLSEFELKKFLAKKNKFLNKLASVLTFVRLKPKIANRVLNEINSKFFQSANLIANANASGGFFRLNVSAGLALPRRFTQYLKQQSLGRFLPKSGGFYYLFGLGVGLVRIVDPQTNKISWVLETFVDKESLNFTTSGIIQAAAGFTQGFVYEYRTEDFRSQTSEVSVGGPGPNSRVGDNQLAWPTGASMAVPPFLGMFQFYKSGMIRHYFFRVNLSKYILDPINRVFAGLRSATPAAGSGSMSCQALFTP